MFYDGLNDPVKVGQMIPDDWVPIIGKRVNILYHRLRRSEPEFWSKFPSIFERSGGQFICNDCTGAQSKWVDAYPQRFYPPIRYVSWELTSELRLEMKAEPLAGSVCIADILTHNIKSAYITGFICMFDREFDNRFALPTPGIEPQLSDLRFLARMNKDNRVTVDSNMQFLFDKHCAHV